MNKKILITTTLALAMCMPFAFAKPSMAACENSESCKTSHQAGCDGKCEDVNCCPVQVGDKCFPTLKDAVAAAENKTITLRADIELTENIQVTKKVTINGKGHTIKASKSWAGTTGDQSLITANGTDGAGAELTLTNVKLEDSIRCGAQAYNGGKLILDGVEVNNCDYGAIHTNGGIIKVKKLILGHNGKWGFNIGIDVSNATNITKTPKIIMDGEIITEETENIIYSPVDGTAVPFEVENKEKSPQKIYSEGNNVLVVNGKGEVLFTSKLNRRSSCTTIWF